MAIPESAAAVTRIEIFTRWIGFASPPMRVAKLNITRTPDGFVGECLPEGKVHRLRADRVAQFLAALDSPCVAQLEPGLFDLPEPVIRRHYDSIWTDDCPAHLLRVTLGTGRVITIRADQQYAFMLPLKVTDSDRGVEYETFDPRLSLSIAALMPDGYLEKDRLAGRGGMLSADLEEFAQSSTQAPDVPAEGPPADGAPGDALSIDETMNEIYRILSGVESPEEKAAAEAAGRLSERLLKRISADDARDLIGRGADPNVADDVGQTALMHAAFPPFDCDRFHVLVEAGADLEARRNDGIAGLHLACAGGEAETAAAWIEAGADVNAQTPEGATPMMLAAHLPDIVRRLIASGADVDTTDNDGHTALVYAILSESSHQKERRVEAITTLISAGTDVNLHDREGVTALRHALRALARVQLEEEVSRAFNPAASASADCERDDQRIAATVVTLIG